jgi:hypothetical protein
MSSGGAGSHDYTVEFVLNDGSFDLCLSIGRASKEVILAQFDKGKVFGIRHHFININDRSDVDTAVADEYTYARDFSLNIPLIRVGVGFGFGEASFDYLLASCLGGSGGLHNSGRDIFGFIDSTAGKDSRAAAGNRGEGMSFNKSLLI